MIVLEVKTQPPKLWSFGFIYLLAISVVNASAFGIISPLVPGYVVSFGATLAIAGTVTGMFSITALFARPLSSILGDRLNKKWILLFALLFNGIAIFLYSLVPGIMWLYPVRIFHGLVFSISGTVSLSLGSDYIPKERLGEGVGYLGLGQIMGMAIGPNIAIYLMEHYTYKLCFILSGIVIMIAGLSVFALRYEHTALRPAKNGGKQSFHFRNFVAVELLPNAIFVAILAVGQGLTNSYLVLLGSERQIANIGLYFITNSAVLLAVRPLMGKMVDRKGSAFAILPGYILAASAMALIGFSSTIWMILAAAVLMAVGAGGAMPAIQVDCLKRLDSTLRTVATGTYLIGMDIGMSSGQILGGVVTGSFGFRSAFISAGTLMLVGFGLYLLYIKYGKTAE